jgi:hypothetical protein
LLPTEDKDCCPTEDKGCCPTEDKGCCPQRTRAAVPQRTRVVVPQRIRVVAPQRTTELTNKLEPIIQTKPIPEPKPSTTILIEGGSQTAHDREPNCYNSCTLCRGLCPVSTHSDFITFQRLENLHVARRSLHAFTKVHFR